MSVKDAIRGIFTGIENNHLKRFLTWRKHELTVVEWKNLWVRRDEWKKDISVEQKKQVDEFFLKYYGKRIPYYWHRMYTNYTGVFDKKYFPEILFSTKLEEKLNPYQVAFPLQNKAFCPQRLFENIGGNIVVPELVFENCRGTFWGGVWLSQEQAENMLNNAGEVIIKPTVDTMGAKGVGLFDFDGGIDSRSGDTVKNILKRYKVDYIVQKKVVNHITYSKLYPNAINTIRVITFITRDGIKVAPLSMRIGVGGRYVDNGGIFIGVNDNGCLNPIGFSKKHIQTFDKHPDTGIVFEGYHLDGIDKIKEAAIKLHSMLPQLKMLSWDMTYDADENVVVIEVNTTAQSVWFPQMVTGKSIFGEYTGDMLELIK